MKKWAFVALAAVAAGAGAGRDQAEEFDRSPSPGQVYEGWEPVRSSEHPAYNRIEWVSEGGNGFVRLTTQGRKTALRMTPGTGWQVDPSLTYRLEARVRLSGTRRNEAVATLVWSDGASRTRGAVRGSGEWTEIQVEIRKVPGGARALAVELGFEGPDVRGTCDIDWVRLLRRPFVDIRPASGVFDSFPAGVEITAGGLPAGEHPLRVRVLDGSGNEKAPASSHRIATGGTARVEFPSLEPGPYEVEARVEGSAKKVPILVASPGPPAEAPAFGAAINPYAQDLPAAAALVRLAGVRRVRVTLRDDPAPGRSAPSPDDLRKLLRDLSAVPSMTLVGELARSLRDHPSDRGALLEHQEFIDSAEPSRTIPPGETGPLLRRLIEAASEPPGMRFFVPLEEPLVDRTGSPRAPLLALRTANQLLSGSSRRRDLGDPFGRPIRSAAFEKDGRLLLALWCEEGEAELDPGPDAEVVTAFGAARRLAPGERLRAGPVPVFVRNLDESALAGRVALEFLDPSRPAVPRADLPLGPDPASRLLRFRNGSTDREITRLRVRIEDPLPAGWRVRPHEMSADRVAPGKDFEREISFTLPASEEEEAAREIRVEASFERDGRAHVVRRTFPLRLVAGIGVGVEVSEGGPGAKKVSVRISNPAARAMNLVATVRLPGLPEQTLPLGSVEPGGAAEPLDYVVRDLHLLDPARRQVEVIAEERGGERLQVRKLVPLGP